MEGDSKPGGRDSNEKELPHPDAEVIMKYPTLFGDVREKCVTFCVDTSGSMYRCLDAIKDDLKKTLLKLSLEADTQFNLIEFSTQVTQWSEGLVKCTQQTVMLAQQWIDKLEAKTGTNALDALMSALTDPTCEAVYLVTDGLPDQNPSEVLDEVVQVAANRPVHCYYIENGITDSDAIDFLQDLAIETFGSFHIVCITQHGAVESITPVYRADTSAERIVRTTSGNIYPSAYKECTVSATLGGPSRVLVESIPPPVIVDHSGYWPHCTTGYYAYPHIGHYYYCYPHTGWSRYRPARGWMKTAEKYIEAASLKPSFAPGAGSVLIDKTVLARRMEDGHYCLGKVKSQLHEDQFLVEFGPSKHGQFKKTAYQETYVYDIISFDDAQRHSILPGDKVLAPWEPESTRYGPGVVVDGQEKRLAEVGISDKDVTVGFFNGQTVKVPANTAVWIPPDLHDRVSYELKMPTKVRQEIADGLRQNPSEVLPGYPSSAKRSTEFDTFEPLLIESRPGYYERGMYRGGHFVPLYKQQGSYFSAPPGYTESPSDRIIPGTELTEAKLNEKVMSQLLLHKMVSEDKYTDSHSKLLSKRGQLEENTLTRKSVKFDDTHVSDVEAEVDETETKDSGRGSATDLGLTDAELDDLLDDVGTQTNKSDAETRTDSSLFYRKKKLKSKSENRPPWRYWGNEPVPDLLESNHYGPYRIGAFRETAVSKPMKSMDKYGTWSTAMSEFVNRFENENEKSTGVSVKESMGYFPRPHCDKSCVKDSLGYQPQPPTSDKVIEVKHGESYCPQPPRDKPYLRGPALDISIQFSRSVMDKDAQLRARNEFRRRQIMERYEKMNERREDELRMSEAMRDKHRERILNQIENDRLRESRQYEMLQQQREAKAAVRHDIRKRFEEKQNSEQERRDQRLSRMMEAKQFRAEQQNQKKQEEADLAAMRQQARQEKIHQHVVSQIEKAEEAERQQLVRDITKQNAKINRIEHFRALEDRAQAMKELSYQVNDQNHQVWRSQVLP